MTARQRIAHALAALAFAALFIAAPVIAYTQPAPHWHGPDAPHGTYGGFVLSEADCEALYGGDGWE